MTIALPHVEAWAKAKASRDENDFFDLAKAIITDGITDETSGAAEVLATCKKHGVTISKLSIDRVVAVACRWGLEKMTERAEHVNSFTAMADLVTLSPDGSLPTAVPLMDDDDAWREATYAHLVAEGKKITRRSVMEALGVPHKDNVPTVTDTAAALTAAATIPAAALADRISTDKDFRDALVDLVVGIEPIPGAVSSATSKATGPLDALAELKKAEAIIRRLDHVATIDPDAADVLRANRTSFKAAVDLLDLTLDGIPAE